MWNILPTNDLKIHVEDSTCHCNPKVEIMENGEIMVIHSSYDNRETYEEKYGDSKLKYGELNKN